MADNAKVNPVGSGAYTINLDNFSKRLKVFYDHWKEHKPDLWGSSDAITIATPLPSEDIRYLKSSALDIWLLGYEFPETIIVFMHKQIHFLCSQKKANLIGTLQKAANEAVGADIVLHVKAKNGDGADLMDDILHAVRNQSKSGNPIVGHIAKEAPEGKLLETWADKLSGSSVQLTDVTNAFSELFAVKDSTEITCVKKAAYLTSSVLKNFVVPKLEKVIDEEKKISHSSLMDDTERAILDPLKVKVKLKAENVDICYPPVFQSGGKFDLKPGASSNDDYLYYDSASVIICAIGSKYGSYCSNVARTYLIDATLTQSKAYETLLKAHEAAVEALKPGNQMSAVYHAALAVIERDAPELLPHLTKSAGTGIGLEFRESGLNLNSKNDRRIKQGMIFNVSLGLHNVQAETTNEKTKQFSLLLADTVLVSEKGHEILTAPCSKAVKDVAYSFNEDEEDVPVAKVEAKTVEVVPTKATLRSDNQEMSKEDLRRQHQAELARQKNEETARRLAGGGSGSGDGRGPARASNELVAYKNVNDVPYARELVIQVDQKNEAVLLPIYGSMVPFHVSTIKSVTSHQDNRTCTIRIFFNVPGMPFSNDNKLNSQGAIYLKEITFRSKDPRHSSEVVQHIKTLRRQVASRESERAERATLVTQEKLQVASNKMKLMRLSDVWIRPAFGGRGRKLTGYLEAHVNGFRYSTSRADERVDIMYGNIKHAFFQPAEKEMITLLHFHLHNHIMVGNKKTKDVQFYVEPLPPALSAASLSLSPSLIKPQHRTERERKGKKKKMGGDERRRYGRRSKRSRDASPSTASLGSDSSASPSSDSSPSRSPEPRSRSRSSNKRRKSSSSSSHRHRRSHKSSGRSRSSRDEDRRRRHRRRRDEERGRRGGDSSSGSGSEESDRAEEAREIVRDILREFPAVAGELRQLLQIIDSGEGIDISSISDKSLVKRLKKLFRSLRLKESASGAYLLPLKNVPTLDIVGPLLLASSNLADNKHENPVSPSREELLSSNFDVQNKDDITSEGPKIVDVEEEPPKRRVIGPAMPSRELLAAAAEMTEALRCRDAELEADDDLLIGPPPPAVVAEAASANEAERFEEVTRILGADTNSPYDVLGVNWKMSTDNMKKRYWKLSLLVHPDKCPHPSAQEAFVKLNNAFKDLQDPDKRSAIDEKIKKKEEMEQFEVELKAMREAAEWRRLQGISLEGDDELLAGPKQAPKRDEWMTTLPPERKAGVVPMHSTKSFSMNGKEGRGDTSVWTDSPLDRAQKAQQSYLEAYNKTKAIAEGDVIKSKNPDASIVDKYNSSKRSVSLVQKHRESKKEKKKQKQSEKEEWEGNHPWKPWDREKDLSAGRQKVSLDPENMSQGLSSRFASGAVQRNFL